MLIRFTVKNFLSFNEKREVLLTPGRVRKHKDHISRSKKTNGIDVLKHSLFYGANASGKSNLVKAIAFAKKLVVSKHKPEKSVPVKPFKLVENYKKKKSMFEFEIKCYEKYYAYGFELNKDKIFEEWLYEIRKNNKEKLLFERTTDLNGSVDIKFGIDLKNNEDRVRFIAKDARENQLFLNAINERNVKDIKGIEPFVKTLKWFKNTLVTIRPESEYAGKEVGIRKDEDFAEYFTNFLQNFDTGIEGVECKEIKPDEGEDVNIPDDLIKNIVDELDKKQTTVLPGSAGERYAIMKNKEGSTSILKIVTKHKIIDKDESVDFDITEESDGTRRMMDIIPSLILAKNSEKVFVIDELDRSLHSHLTYQLIKLFSRIVKDKSCQLLATTHDTDLLDLDLLRRDEIWFIEKNKNGESDIYSLEEYAPRHDKNIKKGYLRGRYGGIPFLKSDLSWLQE